MLEKALGMKRKGGIIATKFGFSMSPRPNGDGLSRRRIIKACDACLDQETDILLWSLLHGEFLSGKYSKEFWPENTRIAFSGD